MKSNLRAVEFSVVAAFMAAALSACGGGSSSPSVSTAAVTTAANNLNNAANPNPTPTVTVTATPGCDSACEQADYNAGYNSGYNDGSSAGSTASYNAGYNQGASDGYNSGYNQGSSDGYNSGYSQGSSDGYNSGYNDGYNSGYSDGYNNGYSDGSYYGYSVAGGTKDTNLQRANVQQATLDVRAQIVADKFSMSLDKAVQITQLADKVQQMSKQGAMTDADRDAVTTSALSIAGVSTAEVNNAFQQSVVNGDNTAAEDLLAKAAGNLGMPSSAALRDQLLPTLGVSLGK